MLLELLYLHQPIKDRVIHKVLVLVQVEQMQHVPMLRMDQQLLVQESMTALDLHVHGQLLMSARIPTAPTEEVLRRLLLQML